MTVTQRTTDPGRTVQAISVNRIRPERGLGRKRDRRGHEELQRSIKTFGVLTPITVREAPDGSGDFLLIKGQGRALACRLLGLETVPAVVVESTFADSEKVQQFLVENVARLKMRPVDRALLIHRARLEGEETAAIAKRFGVATTTVRRLLSQLEDVSTGEVAVLRAGGVSLATHAVVARFVEAPERQDVLDLVANTTVSSKDLEALFVALGWRELTKLGTGTRAQRLSLMRWACHVMESAPKGPLKERLAHLAVQLPNAFERDGTRCSLAVR